MEVSTKVKEGKVKQTKSTFLCDQVGPVIFTLEHTTAVHVCGNDVRCGGCEFFTVVGCAVPGGYDRAISFIVMQWVFLRIWTVMRNGLTYWSLLSRN